uniref:Uncharacterized protein n=1 Tax=Tanacetum cinerariifolium TaxID=118510 RepID=A0A6L2KMZ2_TANCI|nr:hypothetical protein [Tanacetum cinerariifolium]
MEMLFTINPCPHNPTNNNTNVESISSFQIPNQESEPQSEDSDLDNPLLPLPPPEPPDKEFDFEIDFEKEISVERNLIVKFECIDARMKFDVENDVFKFIMFSLLSAESKDTIFDPVFYLVCACLCCDFKQDYPLKIEDFLCRILFWFSSPSSFNRIRGFCKLGKGARAHRDVWERCRSDSVRRGTSIMLGTKGEQCTWIGREKLFVLLGAWEKFGRITYLVPVMMKASFLDSRGRGGKKNKSKDSGSSLSVDASADKEVVLPSVVNKNVEKEKQSSLADTTGLGSRNGIDVVVLVESIRAISEQFANTGNGFFLGKQVAYPVVANYVRNTWGKYGLVRSMFSSSTRLFSFQFNSVEGLDAMLENDVSTVLVSVKIYGVHVTAFSEDGLSAIATKLDVELIDNIVATMPKLLGRATILVIFVLSMSGNLLDVLLVSPSTTPIIEKFDKTEKLIIDGKVTLVDDEGKLLEKVASSCDYDSEDEVVSVNNEMASFLAKKDGYGIQSLLEKWTKSYKNADYGYDPYDDDMYEGQDIPDKLQAICDKLDIIVRGRRKK